MGFNSISHTLSFSEASILMLGALTPPLLFCWQFPNESQNIFTVENTYSKKERSFTSNHSLHRLFFQLNKSMKNQYLLILSYWARTIFYYYFFLENNRLYSGHKLRDSTKIINLKFGKSVESLNIEKYWIWQKTSHSSANDVSKAKKSWI